MQLVRNPNHEGPRGPSAGISPADLFALLWGALGDLLGTSATAVLLRRASLRAAAACPELAALTISRLNLEYRYTLPPGWENQAEDGPLALRALMRELRPLLLELTGRIAIGRLKTIRELQESGILSEKEQP
jgi:hypothetical protein